MKTLYESILDDEEDLIKDEDFLKKQIKSILNTQADIKFNGNDIKIIHSNYVSPTSEFITLKDYTFEDIPNFEVGSGISLKNSNNFEEYINTTNLLNSAWIKLWPHIKHIGKMVIYLYDYKESELDLTNLKIDEIDNLVIRIRKAGTTAIRIKGPKNTKIKQVNIESLLYSIVRPHLITGFNCKRMLFAGDGDSIKGVNANTAKNADIYDPIEFNELDMHNNIDSFIIYNTKLKRNEIFYILYKNGKDWVSKKSAINF